LSGIDDETASPHAPAVSIRGRTFSRYECSPSDHVGDGSDPALGDKGHLVLAV